VQGLLPEVCAELRIGMEACEFGPDHLHVFVSRCKNYCVLEIARRMKGAYSEREQNPRVQIRYIDGLTEAKDLRVQRQSSITIPYGHNPIS
jgi:REP element-mobilizing transposase RayT